jgi:hypothetical protein
MRMRRLLLKYRKEDAASFLSHREAMRAMEMALRRSEIPMVFSEGYSPRPRMSFSPALPLGIAAEAEYLEVAVDGEVDAEEVRDRLNLFLPQGLRISEVQLLAPTMPKLSRWARYGLFRLDGEGWTWYLLLALVGEGQGRLKDALQALAEQGGEVAGRFSVTRAGLYASPEEIFEDTHGRVIFYDGAKKELKEMSDDSRTPQ